jgi:ATP synthase protein I
MREHETSFSRQVALKAARKLGAQRSGDPDAWFGLGMFGMVGWSIAIPTVFGALLGGWLDRHHPKGHSWTLALLVAGLVVGCGIAWQWVSSQNSAAAAPPLDDDE